MRNAAALTALLALTLTARAADDKAPTPPPSFMQAKATEKGDKVQVSFVFTAYRTAEVEETVKVGNTIQVQKRRVTVPYQVNAVYELDGKKATLQRADGKAVSNKDALKELGSGNLILHAPNGKVDPEFLALLKADTLILITSDK